jgi:hypothetical protein
MCRLSVIALKELYFLGRCANSSPGNRLEISKMSTLVTDTAVFEIHIGE